MTRLERHTGITSVATEEWDKLAEGRLPELGHEYLAFREQREPGAPVVITLSDSDGLACAVHGTGTTEASGLFSHPWKMLTATQFLRTEDATVGKRHEELVAAAEPARAALSGAVVIRAYDTSEVLFPLSANESKRTASAGKLVRSLQELVREGKAGAVVFAFVRPGDEVLRAALTETGFRGGCFTAASTVDLSGSTGYANFVAGLPGRVRRHYARAERELPEDVVVAEVPLLPNVDRIAELEVQTAVKNGGSADFEAVREARRRQASLMPAGVRVVAASRHDEILACAVHLVGSGGSCVLAYGCDYTASEGSFAYHYLMFNEPIAHCLGSGFPFHRLGFEAFAPKKQRGAVVERRETWLWLPEATRLDRSADVLDFLTEVNTSHLATFGA